MRKILGVMKRAWAFIEDHLLVLLLVLMLADVLAQILTRSLFNKPLSFTEEVARYIQIWITFLGMGYCVRHRHQIRVTMLYDRLPPAGRMLLDLLGDVFVLWICWVLLQPAYELFRGQSKLSWITVGGVSRGVTYVCVPIGFAVLGMYMLGGIITTARGIAAYYQEKKGGAE